MSSRQWIAPPELTIFQVNVLWQEYLADPPHHCDFHLDLSPIGRLDSAGAQLLLYLMHDARQNGCSPVIQAPSESAKKAIAQLGFNKLLNLEEAQ